MIKKNTGYITDSASFIPCLNNTEFLEGILPLLREKRCGLIVKFDFLPLHSMSEIRALFALYGVNVPYKELWSTIDSETGMFNDFTTDRLNITLRHIIHNTGDSMEVPDATSKIITKASDSPVSKLMGDLRAVSRRIRQSDDDKIAISQGVIVSENDRSFLIRELEKKGYRRDGSNEKLSLITLKKTMNRYKVQRLFLFCGMPPYLVRFTSTELSSVSVIVRNVDEIYFRGMVGNLVVGENTRVLLYVGRNRRKEFSKKSKQLTSIVIALNRYINAIKANIFTNTVTTSTPAKKLDIPDSVYDNSKFLSSSSRVVNTFENTDNGKFGEYDLKLEPSGRLRINGKLSSSYRKPDLIKIANEMNLDTDGTVKQITERMAECLK